MISKVSSSAASERPPTAMSENDAIEPAIQSAARGTSAAGSAASLAAGLTPTRWCPAAWRSGRR